jgi:ABC-type protease/lipase transport system fused ATPase/permease subunit
MPADAWRGAGLDASTALSLMRLLKDIAQATGLVVVCSIHQPRSNIFELLDKLLLLARGRTAYFGDAEAVSATPCQPHIPPPPPDACMACIVGEVPSPLHAHAPLASPPARP